MESLPENPSFSLGAYPRLNLQHLTSQAGVDVSRNNSRASTPAFGDSEGAGESHGGKGITGYEVNKAFAPLHNVGRSFIHHS